MPPAVWIVVLIKDFRTAKTRLAPVMAPPQRRALAEMTAAQALDAALAVGPTLAVCGSEEAAEHGAEPGRHCPPRAGARWAEPCRATRAR